MSAWLLLGPGWLLWAAGITARVAGEPVLGNILNVPALACFVVATAISGRDIIRIRRDLKRMRDLS